MPITNASRFAVHAELESTFSGEVAETIMEMLPPFDWSQIATKQDLVLLRTDIDQRFTAFELRLESKIHKMLGDQIKWMVGTAIALNTLMLTGAIALSRIF